MKDLTNESNLPLSKSGTVENLSKPRLIEQVREVIRCKHYSIRTEQAYINWIGATYFFMIGSTPSIWQSRISTRFLPIWRSSGKLPHRHKIRHFARWCFSTARF